MRFLLSSIILGFTFFSWSNSFQAPKSQTCQASFDLAIQALRKGQSPIIPESRSCPVEHRVISWMRYTQASDNFEEMAQFLRDNPFWPDQSKIREMTEHAIVETTPDKSVVDYFNTYPPLTSKGALIYGERFWRTHKEKRAIPKIQHIWIHADFKPKDEETFYRLFKQHLSPEVNHDRINRLILDGNYYGLKQMKQYISHKGRQVVDYAMDLIQKKSSFQLQWTGVPKSYKQYPGLVFQYIKWLLSKKRELEALKVFEDGMDSNAFKDNPDLVLRYRNYFARYFIHENELQKSYEIAVKYPVDPARLKSRVDYVEGEWLIAWIELRKQKKPDKASKRFEALYGFVSTSISRAKMAYWCGRAEEEAGNSSSAEKWYGKAAELSHTYYGQLALKKLNKPIKINLKKEPNPVSLKEQETHLIEAIHLLTPYGFSYEKEKLLMYLAQNGQEGLGEFLVNLSHEINMPHLAVIIAKFMGQKSPVLTEQAYPTLELPSHVCSRPFLDDVLIHAVIRQESNFNSRSISTAGARGFMQLMQDTAHKVAKKLRMKFHWKDLTKKPHKNIELGTAYLSDILKQFKGHHVVALAGYNAGPHKAEEWVRIYGHPSSKDVDLVDWIESIPYGETRGYVQRITESLPIYAERLGKKSLHPCY